MIDHIKDLKPDPRNARAHTPRNVGLIETALNEVGAARSIVIDENGVVLAGNATIEAAAQAGIEKVQVVDADGNTIIAVRRSNLTPEQKTRLALFDNRAAELADWDAGVLAALAEETDLSQLFRDEELAALLERAGSEILDAATDAEDLPDDSAADDIDDLLAPFPWFGGKARVAGRIWARFGEVENYVEPFCGSAAVLLACPYDIPTRTVNDADGFIANFWRAVEYAPDEVARHADWPVNENDLFARHIWLVTRSGELTRKLETDPDYYDAKIAGWWVWGCCAWIGTGWCSGEGPWAVEGEQVINRKLPHLGDAGRGVNRQLPHLGDAGRGVNRQLPHLGNAGQGVCAVWSEHIRDYMQRLSDKLRRVRVCCGDWARIVTPSVTERHGTTAILLDPPYGEGAQEYSAGGNGDSRIAADVWEWAVANGDNENLRIAVCGYDDGRSVAPGWSMLRWTARKGYQATDTATLNPSREVVWFSPHCLVRERDD